MNYDKLDGESNCDHLTRLIGMGAPAALRARVRAKLDTKERDEGEFFSITNIKPIQMRLWFTLFSNLEMGIGAGVDFGPPYREELWIQEAQIHSFNVTEQH